VEGAPLVHGHVTAAVPTRLASWSEAVWFEAVTLWLEWPSPHAPAAVRSLGLPSFLPRLLDFCLAPARLVYRGL
jgi:hypothetical protein